MNWWHAPFSQSRLVAFPIPLDDPSMSPTSHQLHHRKAFWLRNCTSSLGYLWLFGVSTIETQNFGVHFETKLNEFARWFGRNLRTTDVCEFWGASRCLVPNFNQYTFLETTVQPCPTINRSCLKFHSKFRIWSVVSLYVFPSNSETS